MIMRARRIRGEDGRLIDEPDYYKQFNAYPDKTCPKCEGLGTIPIKHERRVRCNECKRFTEQPMNRYYHKNLKLCSCNKHEI